ncbi:alpha-N-acetylneuraminide alpha-2,8-sialyltransferase-like [Branchiostoma floridae]|uniref:Alpha-N-acetylneuraminide alpha-2,8-sialyltransferase-like n=1 Tax=Branchiostoma floridae TaxID=7739 RepID=A0A9J7LF42_BRAFL|nr:alpha-N-acetylneuraminide alpha-2,8-sialyltransferase-like [Branchiostoma floridae]
MRRRFQYLSTRFRPLGFRRTTFNVFLALSILGIVMLIYGIRLGSEDETIDEDYDADSREIINNTYSREVEETAPDSDEASSEEESEEWHLNPLPALKALWSKTERTVPVMPELDNAETQASQPNPIIERVEKHWNEERCQAMQNLSRRFYDPRRHVIHLRELYKFERYCNSSTFTLKTSKTKFCDVVSTPIRQYRTCAVVGNGGILLNSSCGAEIDAHDFVVRSNLPPTLPYRQDVGIKTNFTAVNFERLIQVRDQLKSSNPRVLDEVFTRFRISPGMVFAYGLSLQDVRNQRRMAGTARTVRERGLPVTFAFAHRSYMDGKGMWYLLSGKQNHLPSTGLNLVGLAWSFCDRISLYGYFPFDSDIQGNKLPYHYYDQKLAEGSHNMANEFIIYRRLHDLGIIRHVFGRCEANP